MQLFVTKNQVLCSEVQKNFRELCHADDVAAQHVTVEDNPLPHRLQVSPLRLDAILFFFSGNQILSAMLLLCIHLFIHHHSGNFYEAR